ncbi:O-antigen ligase family protein [Candidatus Daviesbacteria bacterium]|nr:O-antigen ligase family protein [Candidatus Daviesbacteria bacterium]
MASLSRTSWLFVFLVFALPLVFFPYTYLAFEMPKVFLLYLFTVSTPFLLLKSGYRLGNFSKVYLLYLVFFAWIILTAALGLSFGQSFLGSYFRWQGIITWICYFVLFFISAKLFENPHFKKYTCYAILIASTVTALLAITQFALYWFDGNTTQLLYNRRVISTFGQPNFLGAYLVMSLPFTWLLLKQANLKQKGLIGLGLIIIILGILSTTSRSAYLGLIFLALIWGIFHYRLLLAGIIASIILLTILANLFPLLVFNEWYRFKIDTTSKWTAENRLLIAQRSVQLVLQKPLTGYGLENFSLAFPAVVNSQDLGLKDIVVDSSHNLFLDLAVQLGLVGLGLFLASVSSALITGLKRLKSADIESQQLIKAAICVVITFLSMHQFSVVSVVPMVLFWVSLGIITGPALAYHAISKLSRNIISLAGISSIIIISLLIIQTIRADILFREASAYEVSDIHRSIKLDNDAIKIAPWIYFYQVRRDFLLKQLGYN